MIKVLMTWRYRIAWLGGQSNRHPPDDNGNPAYYINFMNMSGNGKFVRLCFIVVFGAMSLMHGPVMAYSGHRHIMAAHDSHGAGHPGHGHSNRDHGKPAEPPMCNGFACFIAVEPIPTNARPPYGILFGVMTLVPTELLHAVAARPDLPPPRLQS